jgi:predicted PurR-regulated permease PerM
VIVSLLALVVGMGVLVAPRLGSQLPDLSNQLTDSVKELLAQVRASGRLDNITEEAPHISGRLLGNLDAGAILGGAFSSISAAVTAVFLVLFVGVFLAFDPGLYHRGLLLLVPPARRQRADEVLRASLDTLWWWTLGRLFAMTVVGIATGIGLWFLGVPMAFTLGAIAGLISFVPTIGAVLAILPALLLAVQQGWSTVLYVFILYGCIQALENNVLTPLVQQKAVSVPPVILIVTQVLMGILVGIMGVVIATPLAALVIELVRELYVKEDVEMPSPVQRSKP